MAKGRLFPQSKNYLGTANELFFQHESTTDIAGSILEEENDFV